MQRTSTLVLPTQMDATLDTTVEDEEDASKDADKKKDVAWGLLVPLTPKTVPVAPKEFGGAAEVTIGRAPTCTVQVNSPHISGTHCKLYMSEGKAYVVDLSTNGTYVDGERVPKGDPAVLTNGAELLLSQSNNETKAAFIFKDLLVLEKKKSSNSMTSSASSATLTHTSSDVHEQQQQTPGKRSREDGSDSESDKSDKKGKKPKVDVEEDEDVKKSDNKDTTTTNTTTTTTPTTTSGGGGSSSSGSSSSKAAPNDDVYEEHLTCGICQALLYKCISCIPCMHNFCSACIGEWAKRSRDCPQCRGKVKIVRKNHLINNLVDTYLSQHPENARAKDELDAMDASNPITEKMLEKGSLKGLAGWDQEYENEEDEEYSDEDDDDEEEEDTSGVCRECTNPRADGWQCPPGNAHLYCSVCYQPFPSRPPTHPHPSPVPTSCELCGSLFCDQYWGGQCSWQGNGTLKQLSQHVMTAVPPQAFNNNQTEVQSVLDIANHNALGGVGGVWGAILAKLDDGSLTYNGSPTHIAVTGNKVACRACANTTFANTLYGWRCALPAHMLPPAVAARADCHWGRACKTQHHKLDHAKRFNHCCEQTRF